MEKLTNKQYQAFGNTIKVLYKNEEYKIQNICSQEDKLWIYQPGDTPIKICCSECVPIMYDINNIVDYLNEVPDFKALFSTTPIHMRLEDDMIMYTDVNNNKAYILLNYQVIDICNKYHINYRNIHFKPKKLHAIGTVVKYDNKIGIICKILDNGYEINYDYQRYIITDYRVQIANNVDKDEFMSELKDNEYYWNCKQHQIVSYNWIPKDNEKYWYITTEHVYSAIWKNHVPELNGHINSRNVFNSKELAKRALKQVTDVLINAKHF